MFVFMNENIKKIIFAILFLASFTPWVGGPLALLFGFIMAILIGNPYSAFTKDLSGRLLKASVVGLGFGMNLEQAMETTGDAFYITIITIASVLILGFLLGKLLGIEKKLSHLIATGTAICGGSAIAAVAPIVDANDDEKTLSLGTIFILNSIALFIFPYLGELLIMSNQEYGIWTAIAIHDTSSVVGAAEVLGDIPLKIATTVKLSRALWIIPVALLSSFLFKSKGSKIKIPWFILYFILALVLNTLLPQFQEYFTTIYTISRKGLVVTLFLIGSGISLSQIKNVGFKPMLLGVILWVIVSVGSYYLIV